MVLSTKNFVQMCKDFGISRFDGLYFNKFDGATGPCIISTDPPMTAQEAYDFCVAELAKNEVKPEVAQGQAFKPTLQTKAEASS